MNRHRYALQWMPRRRRPMGSLTMGLLILIAIIGAVWATCSLLELL